MLMQLHHQNKKNLNEHEMVAQSEIKNQEEMQSFVDRIKISHPLISNKYQWLACNEKSEYFSMAAVEDLGE